MRRRFHEFIRVCLTHLHKSPLGRKSGSLYCRNEECSMFCRYAINEVRSDFDNGSSLQWQVGFLFFTQCLPRVARVDIFLCNSVAVLSESIGDRMVDTSGVGAASAFDALQNAQSSASTFPSGSASQSLFDSANKVDITSNNQSVFDTILASSAGSAANRIGSKPPDDPLGGAGLFGGKGAIGGQSSAESVTPGHILLMSVPFG